MSSELSPFDRTSLRRTRSTGDMPSTEIQRPSSVHLSPTFRRSESFRPGITQDRASHASHHAAAEQLETALPDPVSTTSPSPPTPLDIPVVHANPRRRETRSQTNRPLLLRLLGFFGIGRDSSKARKDLASVVLNLLWAFIQLVVISVVLGITARLPSPTRPSLNEWQACGRPLGAWSIFWLVEVGLAAVLAYWGFLRERKLDSRRGDVESSNNTSRGAEEALSSASQRLEVANISSGTGASTSPPNDSNETRPHSTLFSRLNLFSSLITWTWFLAAHIILYTSIKTCRFSSPHLWWLTFAILCIMYLIVLEVVFLFIMVFIIAPIIFIFWNIALIVLGRHPLQNGGGIRPEIDKLPKSLVDCIPLVMYIPPPPDEPVKNPITIPENLFTYPPTSAPPKRRFRFLRSKKPKSKPNELPGPATNREGEETSWEDNFEHADYPFVRLDGNRATCAICLMDFAEPKRVAGQGAAEEQTGLGEQGLATAVEPGEISNTNPVDHETPTTGLHLEDAGEESQPLRLLECGHVFHQTCLDPWLTDVSGRCPVCQRAVTVKSPKKKRRNQNR